MTVASVVLNVALVCALVRALVVYPDFRSRMLGVTRPVTPLIESMDDYEREYGTHPHAADALFMGELDWPEEGRRTV